VTSTANQSVPQAELSENTVWRGTRYTVIKYEHFDF